MSDYKRLTERNSVGLVDTLCKNCMFNGDCTRYRTHCDRAVRERLYELEDKIENGTLIELPCKVGDTVWYIKNYGFGRYVVEDMEVAGFNFSKYENTIWVVGKYEEEASHIYKTKAEAEAKLKELRVKYE